MSKAEVIKTTNLDGEEMVVVVKPPKRKDLIDAQCYASQVVKKAMDNEVPNRDQIKEYMVKQGYWNDDKEKQLNDVDDKIAEGEAQLRRGGVTKKGEPFTKKQAKELAINMRIWRAERMILLTKYAELDEWCLESQAENARHDFLTSACTKDEEGNRIFKDIDDYLEKAEEPYAVAAATYLGHIIHGLDPKFVENRPENKFLVEHGFAREEDGRLINEHGQLVDAKGNVVAEEETEAEFVPFPD